MLDVRCWRKERRGKSKKDVLLLHDNAPVLRVQVKKLSASFSAYYITDVLYKTFEIYTNENLNK